MIQFVFYFVIFWSTCVENYLVAALGLPSVNCCAARNVFQTYLLFNKLHRTIFQFCTDRSNEPYKYFNAFRFFWSPTIVAKRTHKFNLAQHELPQLSPSSPCCNCRHRPIIIQFPFVVNRILRARLTSGKHVPSIIINIMCETFPFFD